MNHEPRTMNIDRHNYEEFFLLYVDNELSAAEKNVVDVFVRENPDLQEELMLLQQSVISVDPVVFENKNELLKNGEFALLQEKLILYMDNELGAADKKSIEALITTDAKVYREFNLLRQTRLEPDDVVFADKKLLYKKDTVRVIPIKWWRIAAAAVLLLGIGVWSGITLYKNYNNPAGGEVVVAKDKGQQKENKINETTIPVATDTSSKNSNVVEEKIAPVVPQDNLAQQPAQKRNPPAEKNNQAILTQQKENIVSNKPVEKPSNNLPKPYFENINNKKSNETDVSNVIPKNGNNSIKNSGNENTTVQVNPKERSNDPKVTDINSSAADPKNTTALQAVYNPNNDRFVEMDEDKAKRTKVGGFLRKVKRMLERTANIKTGDEIKVAGFEIAIK